MPSTVSCGLHLCLVGALLLAPGAARGQDAPPPPGPIVERDTRPQQPPPSGAPATRAAARPWHVRTLNATAGMSLDSAVALLERRHLSAAYLAKTPRAERVAIIGRVRQAALAANTVRVTEDTQGIHMSLVGAGSGVTVSFTIEDAPPFGIASLALTTPVATSPPPAAPPLTWEGLSARIREAEADGVAGQLLVRRQGEEVLRLAFGQSDREANRVSALDAIYCIGSTPIDFTIAAAHLLADRKLLDLDAPLGGLLPGVPADKAGLTVRMILDGRSGLQDFHHTADDWNADLAWIDRDEAVRRILSRPLLAPPGAERRPSHSAFGLLAALIEIVTGRSYPEFVRTEILQPLGMTRTGFYGESLGQSADQFATGYGRESIGLPNIPPNWGPTSWLVMGSGGMVSTLDDLRRFYDAMAAGTLYADRRSVLPAGRSVNGSDRGFLVTRSADGRGNEVLLMSNTDTHPALRPLMNAIVALVARPGDGR